MVQSKLSNTGRSVFSEIADLVEETGALDMAMAKTDFPSPKELLTLSADKLLMGFNNYASSEGVLELRKVIAERMEEHCGFYYHPETEITISGGTVQAVYSAISAFIRDDDEVIVFEPAFESFVPAIVLNGGKPVYVELKAPEFRIDWEEIRKVITSKTRMIILNSPHNPTGAVLNAEDMDQLQRLTNGTNIIILSDETFESLIYDNQVHQSIARFEKLRSRSLIVSSPGPVYHINGWGIAYCLAPEELMIEYRKIQRIQLANVNAPLQYALAEYMKEHYSFAEIAELYQGKRNYFNRLLAQGAYKIIPAQGGYFEILDYSAVSNEPDRTFVERLAHDYKIGVIPLSSFYHEKTKSHYIRVCFAKENVHLEEAADRLLNVPVPMKD